MEDLSRPDDGFESWYRTAHRQVVAALTAYSGDLGASAEATDEAFSRACAVWPSVRLMASPTGWTFVVARNVLRRNKRRFRLEGKRMGAEARVRSIEQSDDAETVHGALEVADALRSLTKRQRDIVVLHHGLDLSQDVVAALLGISRSTVATTLMDTRHILRRNADADVSSRQPPKGGQRA
jgi:RNA polymerase sigma-70 factor (ECF subfamily)